MPISKLNFTFAHYGILTPYLILPPDFPFPGEPLLHDPQDGLWLWKYDSLNNHLYLLSNFRTLECFGTVKPLSPDLVKNALVMLFNFHASHFIPNIESIISSMVETYRNYPINHLGDPQSEKDVLKNVTYRHYFNASFIGNETTNGNLTVNRRLISHLKYIQQKFSDRKEIVTSIMPWETYFSQQNFDTKNTDQIQKLIDAQSSPTDHDRKILISYSSRIVTLKLKDKDFEKPLVHAQQEISNIGIMFLFSDNHQAIKQIFFEIKLKESNEKILFTIKNETFCLNFFKEILRSSHKYKIEKSFALNNDADAIVQESDWDNLGIYKPYTLRYYQVVHRAISRAVIEICTIESQKYHPLFQIICLGCGDGKDAYTISKKLQQSDFNYKIYGFDGSQINIENAKNSSSNEDSDDEEIDNTMFFQEKLSPENIENLFTKHNIKKESHDNTSTVRIIICSGFMTLRVSQHTKEVTAYLQALAQKTDYLICCGVTNTLIVRRIAKRAGFKFVSRTESIPVTLDDSILDPKSFIILKKLSLKKHLSHVKQDKNGVLDLSYFSQVFTVVSHLFQRNVKLNTWDTINLSMSYIPDEERLAVFDLLKGKKIIATGAENWYSLDLKFDCEIVHTSPFLYYHSLTQEISKFSPQFIARAAGGLEHPIYHQFLTFYTILANFFNLMQPGEKNISQNIARFWKFHSLPTDAANECQGFDVRFEKKWQ